jgi:hypothetical protein
MKQAIRLSVVSALFVLAASSPARADGFIFPFVGFHFGGDSGCPEIDECENKRLAAGVSFGALGDVVGFEADFGYAEQFFGAAPGFESNVLTFTGNLMIVPKLGPIRPYALGGLGLLRTTAALSLANILLSENNSLGYSVGGGLMIFFGENLGIRGDVRVFKTLQDLTFLGFEVPDSRLGFGRASAGLMLKF